MNAIQLKRTYDEVEEDDGFRILVDRLWPRGIKKENLTQDWWPKEIAPTTETRKIFDHDKDKFGWFKEVYREELNRNEKKEKFLKEIQEQLEKQPVTLVYAAKDREVNHVVVLKEWIEEQLNKKTLKR
ncbi:DUF488 domain-containing protein [Lacticigenium naphthae]|uniref:DUF488 domain-containing protein n=1 Tax=Lacticigenium naphthae TaxID=515351 RepID=UPI0003FF4AC2|nr:DUF488 family protein [Lacticigenium naphthae]